MFGETGTGGREGGRETDIRIYHHHDTQLWSLQKVYIDMYKSKYIQTKDRNNNLSVLNSDCDQFPFKQLFVTLN